MVPVVQRQHMRSWFSRRGFNSRRAPWPSTNPEATMTCESLERPTLVLNRHWRPVRVTTVVRALVMVWNDSARVVEPDEYRLYSWEDWSRRMPPADAPRI